MLGLIILEVRVGFPDFEYAFLDSVIDPVLGGVGLEGGEAAPVDDELRDELLEVLVQVLVALLDVLELVEDAIAHAVSFNYNHSHQTAEQYHQPGGKRVIVFVICCGFMCSVEGVIVPAGRVIIKIVDD